MDEGGWIGLTVVADTMEADLLVGRLRDEGLEARAVKTGDAPAAWLTGFDNPFGPIRILVPPDQLAPAQALLGLAPEEGGGEPPAAGPARTSIGIGVVVAGVVVGLVFAVLALVLR